MLFRSVAFIVGGYREVTEVSSKFTQGPLETKNEKQSSPSTQQQVLHRRSSFSPGTIPQGHHCRRLDLLTAPLARPYLPRHRTTTLARAAWPTLVSAQPPVRALWFLERERGAPPGASSASGGRCWREQLLCSGRHAPCSRDEASARSMDKAAARPRDEAAACLR